MEKNINCKVISANANGLLNKKKCGAHIKWLMSLNPLVIYLQETHLKTNFPKIFIPRAFPHSFFASAGLAMRGVAIYFSNKVLWEFVKIVRDPKGRWIWVTTRLQGKILNFFNYYGPVTDDISALMKINEHLLGTPGQVILGGDFNYIQDLKKDTSNKNKNQLKPNTKKLIDVLKQEYQLVDPWRIENPDMDFYTCHSHRFGTSSRIDYFLISRSLQTSKVGIGCNPFSDHAYISLELILKGGMRSPPRWQLDRLLLQDLEWMASFRKWIIEYFQINDNTAEPFSVWGGFKAAARGQIITFAAVQHKTRKLEIAKLQLEAEKEYALLLQSLPNRYAQAKLALRDFFALEEICSSQNYQQKTYEESQLVGKLLANLTKKKQEAATILKVLDPQTGGETTKSNEISQIFLNHFQQLYSTEHQVEDEWIQNYFLNLNIPKLSTKRVGQLSLDVETVEILTAIKTTAGAKACGQDGFPIEFYKAFAGELLIPLKKLFNYIKEGGMVPVNFKESIIVSFVKKDKNPADVNSYRPISLLNSDYKILMKIWAERFSLAAQESIHSDQTGFIKGRSMAVNTEFLIHALDYFNTNSTPACIIMMDAEKAFDLVNWKTLFFILGSFGFPTQIVKMVQNIYQEATATVVINATKVGNIKICRGTRQGCPLSPLLFTFFIEPLVIKMRNNPDIQPPIPGMAKLKLFADDIILYLKPDKINLEIVLKEFKNYELIGGYKINSNKTEVLALNVDLNFLPLCLKAQAFKTDPIRYLGMFVSNQHQQLFRLNYIRMKDKIKKLLEQWLLLPLSLIGRVSLIKMSILPLLLFLFINVPIKVDASFFKEMETLFRKFIWAKKASRVKLLTVQLPIKQGGLALPHLKTYYEAAFLNLVSGLLRSNGTRDSYFLDKMTQEMGSQTSVFLKTSKFPKRTRYKTLKDYSFRLSAFFKKTSSSGLHFVKLGECRNLGLQLRSKTIKTWENCGLSELRQFSVLNRAISWQEIIVRAEGCNKPAFFEYLQIVHFLTDIKEIFDAPNYLISTLYATKLHGVGNWYRLLQQHSQNPLIENHLARIASETQCSFTLKDWEEISLLGNKTLRAANFKRMSFLSRWLSYYTPAALNKRFPEVPNKCFRCQRDGEGGWHHIFFTCPRLNSFWESIFIDIGQALGKKVPLEADVVLFAFCKDRLLLTEAEKVFLCISCTVARSLVLQNWNSKEIPSHLKWFKKMQRTRNFEEAYAKRLGAIKKFRKNWKFFSDLEKLKDMNI